MNKYYLVPIVFHCLSSSFLESSSHNTSMIYNRPSYPMYSVSHPFLEQNRDLSE